MGLDVESRETLDEAIDRAQAAVQQVLATVDQSATKLLEGVTESGVEMVAQLDRAIQPLVDESAKWRAEVAAWRELLASGITIHAGGK